MVTEDKMGGINLDRLNIITSQFRLDGTDHWDCDGNSLELESGLILYSLVRRYQPKIIVETGTWKGVSTAFMACALADIYEGYTHRPKGEIYTVDLDASKNVGCATQLWRSLGVEGYIRWLVGKSTDLVPAHTPVDMYFLDAGHLEGEIMEEWNHLQKFAAPKGILVGHDTSNDASTRRGTMKVMEMPNSQKIEFPNMRGLMMIQWGESK